LHWERNGHAVDCNAYCDQEVVFDTEADAQLVDCTVRYEQEVV
jgi:hypothetical protein